jgi:uncharacterized protein
MLLNFFFLLKNNHIPVSIQEYFDLLHALNKNLHNYSIDTFYQLSKTILIKNEKHLDTFDKIFGAYFSGIEYIPENLFTDIPQDWLEKNSEKFLSSEEMEKIKATGDFQALMEKLKKLLEEQKERHEGGNKWIGTGGTSPFGAYGYNPEGIRIGQENSRHRRAVKVWDKREYKDLRDDQSLDNRNFKVALRYLRNFSKTGVKDQLNIDKTIKKTSENAGILNLEMEAQKRNNIKVLIFFDIGGSMDDHIYTSEKLFNAALYEFKNLQTYYFHNCIYENVWTTNKRNKENRVATFDILKKYNSDYKVIFIGDAAMSPYEILYAGAAVEHHNPESGLVWLERIKNHFKNIVWLNPSEKNEWQYTQSIQIIKKVFENRMFELSPIGIKDAMKTLLNSSKIAEK